MKYIPLIGRILFSVIFMYSSISKFSSNFVYEAAAKGIPFADVLIPFSGILELVGALSILSGFMSKWGAWLIVIVLVPVTLVMHDFWNVTDSLKHELVLLTFMRNMGIIGGALMIAYFGSGPISIDEYKPEENNQAG